MKIKNIMKGYVFVQHTNHRGGVMYLILIVLLLVPLIKMKKRDSNVLYMQKDNTKSFVNGYQCLIIFFVHYFCTCQNALEEPLLFRVILLAGMLSVSLFFFESGYGVMTSFKNNDDYLKSFFVKRILKTYGVFVLFNFFAIIINGIFKIKHISYKTIIMSFVDPFNAYLPVAWFVITIIIYYIVFYVAAIIAKLLNKKDLTYIIVLSIYVFILILKYVMNVGIVEHYLSHGGAFAFGLIVGTYREKIEIILKKSFYLMFAIGIVLFGYFYVFLVYKGDFGIFYNYFNPIIISYLASLILFKFDFSNNLVLKTMSKYSVPIYYIHMTVLNVLITLYPNLIYGTGKLIGFAIFVIFSFVIAFFYEIVIKNKQRIGKKVCNILHI